jgi:hypothetical protein
MKIEKSRRVWTLTPISAKVETGSFISETNSTIFHCMRHQLQTRAWEGPGVTYIGIACNAMNATGN